MKWVPTTDDQKHIHDSLNDMMRSQCDSREEHQYHLDQMKSCMESQRDSKKTSSSTPNLKKRNNPDEVYSDQRIVDVIKIWFDQGHGQEFMKEIVVKRSDGEYIHFSKSDYKYLHKNDVEDMYLMCLNGKIKYQETGILKSLIVFIKSSVIYEIVHDYQLGLESYQLKDEIPKFCDGTLKRILKEVKKINLDVKHGYADPTLSKDDVEFMVFYEEYFKELLRHRDQMRRSESYANGRPLQQR
ncbi:hypothetical protein Tco_0287433 [Tanacetum coccineum]